MVRNFIIAAIMLFAVGCSERKPTAGAPQVTVMTVPVGAVVRAVAGEAVAVNVVVPAGKDVHEYEPSPADLRSLHSGGLYLQTGLQGEARLVGVLDKSGVRVFDLTGGIERLPYDEHHADHDHGDDEFEREFGDPHVWMSPGNCLKLARNAAAILAENYPDHRAEFEENAAIYCENMAQVQARVSTLLAPYQGRRFYVFHPAFGYFAKEFKLEQCAIEPAGKTPSPRELERILTGAAADKVRCIYASREFNLALPRVAAEMLKCRLELFEPLPPDPAAAFLNMAEKLASGFAEEDAP